MQKSSKTPWGGQGGLGKQTIRHQKEPSCCHQNTRTIIGWVLGTSVTRAKTFQSDHQASR